MVRCFSFFIEYSLTIYYKSGENIFAYALSPRPNINHRRDVDIQLENTDDDDDICMCCIRLNLIPMIPILVLTIWSQITEYYAHNSFDAGITNHRFCLT